MITNTCTEQRGPTKPGARPPRPRPFRACSTHRPRAAGPAPEQFRSAPELSSPGQTFKSWLRPRTARPPAAQSLATPFTPPLDPQPRPSAPPTGRHVSPPATPPLDPGPAPNCPSRGPRPAPDDAPKPASLWLRPSPNSPGLMLPLLPRQGGGAPAMHGKEEPGLCSGETPTPGKLSLSTKGAPKGDTRRGHRRMARREPPLALLLGKPVACRPALDSTSRGMTSLPRQVYVGTGPLS